MQIKQHENSLNFKGRVFFVNKTARDHAKEYRRLIHNLKHNTVNNSIDHFVYLNVSKNGKFAVFNILTRYNYPLKFPSRPAEVYNVSYIGTGIKNGEMYLLNKLEKIREWKRQIDLTPRCAKFVQSNILPSKNKGNKFLNKIKNYFLNICGFLKPANKSWS